LAEPIGEIAQENEDGQKPERPMDIEFGPEGISQIERLKHGGGFTDPSAVVLRAEVFGLEREALNAVVS
jgi:hypothetical protein